MHPDKTNRDLWLPMPDYYTWLWNGLRGGLIVPAADMEFSGLNAKAFISQWTARSADEAKIKDCCYFAYELQGFYEFSDRADDKTTEKN